MTSAVYHDIQQQIKQNLARLTSVPLSLSAVALISPTDLPGLTSAWMSLASHGKPLSFTTNKQYMSLVMRKPVFGVSDQVLHKSGCRAHFEACLSVENTQKNIEVNKSAVGNSVHMK